MFSQSFFEHEAQGRARAGTPGQTFSFGVGGPNASFSATMQSGFPFPDDIAEAFQFAFGGATEFNALGATQGGPGPSSPSEMPSGFPFSGGFPFSSAFPFAAFGEDMQAFFQMQHDEQQEAHSQPTASAVLHDFPSVKVMEYDLQNGSDQCSICLENFAIDETALRVPCGHLFHEGCIRKWLQASNQCPVCRYELPTDDAEFEQGRCERARNQKPRLKAQDVARRSVQELKYLARHFGVSLVGCLEKPDIIEAIASSGAVTIVPESSSGSESSETGTRQAEMPSFAKKDSLLMTEHVDVLAAEERGYALGGDASHHDNAVTDNQVANVTAHSEEAEVMVDRSIVDSEEAQSTAVNEQAEVIIDTASADSKESSLALQVFNPTRRLWAAIVQKVLGTFRKKSSDSADTNVSLDLAEDHELENSVSQNTE